MKAAALLLALAAGAADAGPFDGARFSTVTGAGGVLAFLASGTVTNNQTITVATAGKHVVDAPDTMLAIL